MKRSTKIIVAISLLLIITFWGLDYLNLSTVLIPYGILVLGLGIHAAYTILSSVFSLKDHPEERKAVNEDIKKALKFYEDNGIRFHTKLPTA